MAKSVNKKARGEIVEVLQGLKAGDNVQDSCAKLLAYYQQVLDKNKGDKVRGLFELIGEGTDSKIQFLLDKLGMTQEDLTITYSDRKDKNGPHFRTIAVSELAAEIERCQGAPSLARELHAIYDALSAKINNYMIASASKDLSPEDAFALKLTDAITNDWSQDKVDTMVAEARAQGVNIEAVMQSMESKVAEKAKGLIGGVVIKAPEPEKKVKKTFEIPGWIKKLLPHKGKEKSPDDKLTIDIPESTLDSIAKYIAVSKVLDASSTEVENFVQARLIAREFDMALVDPETKLPDPKLTAPDPTRNYEDMVGEVRGADGTVTTPQGKDDAKYANVVKTNMQLIRESLQLGEDNPIWAALAKFIDNQGNISALNEEEKKLLTTSKILKALKGKIDNARSKAEGTLEAVLDDLALETFADMEKGVDEPVVEIDEGDTGDSLKEKEKKEAEKKPSLREKFSAVWGAITGPFRKKEGQETDAPEVDEDENETDKKEPKKSLKERRAERKAQRKLNKEKVEEREEKKNELKPIELLESVESIYPDKNCLAKIGAMKEVIGGMGENFFENSRLKNLFAQLQSIWTVYSKEADEYKKFPPIEALLAGIELECESIQVQSILPEAKVKTPKKSKKEKAAEAVSAEESYRVLGEKIDEMYRVVNESTGDFDKQHVRYLIQESIKLTGFGVTEAGASDTVKTSPEDVVAAFKDKMGITPDMSVEEMLGKIRKFARHPKVFTSSKDKVHVAMYAKAIEDFGDFYTQLDPKPVEPIETLSVEEFAKYYGKSLAYGQLYQSLTDSQLAHTPILEEAQRRVYRSINQNSKKMFSNALKDAENTKHKCANEMGRIQEVLLTANLPQELAGVQVKPEFDLSGIDPTVRAKIEEIAQKTMTDLLSKITMMPEALENAPELGADLESEGNSDHVEEPPVVEMTDLMGEFNAFVQGNDDREKAVVDYGASYTIDIAGGFGVVETMYLDQFEDLKNIALNPDMDKAAKTTAITKAIKANKEMMATFTELAGAENVDKFVDAFVSHMVDMYITKSGIETVIDDFNKGKEEQNQVKDPKLFADKVACAQAITGLQGKADLSPDEQKLLNSLRTEYYNILQKEIALGIELSDSDKKFIETYEKSKVPTPTNDGGDHDYTYDLSNFEKGYAEWKELADKKAKGEALHSNEEEAAKLEAKYQKFIEDNLKEIVKKVQSCGSQFTDDQEPTGGEQLTDDERAFLGANAAEVGALIKDKTQHNDFCKGIIAQGKAVPNITAEKVQGDDGKVTYSLSIHAQKTYEELFPSTDISAKIAKTVKDLKDAYVYLKPGIKLCDKLIDYIKTLNFDVPTTTNTGDMPEKTEDDPTKDPVVPETPSTDKDKLEALLKEINEKLEDLKKAVEMAGKGVESEKMKGMELSGDILAKLTDVNKILTKEGQDKDIVTTYTPRYMDASSALYNYHSQLLGMGQLQIPATPIGNGMYAIPGNMLGFLSMANQQMFGAAYAGFMGLDPKMFGNMYAQMRPTFTTSITVLGSKGEKVTMRIKLAAGLINDSQVNLFKKDIHDHIFNFLETKSNDIDAIKGDLTTYLEEILPGSVIEQSTLTNVMTGEITEAKQDPVVKSDDVVRKAGTQELENAAPPKQRFDCTLDKGVLTVTDNGKPVTSEPVKEGQFTEKQVESFRKQLASIDETQLKTPDDVRRAIDSALATMGLGEREIGE